MKQFISFLFSFSVFFLSAQTRELADNWFSQYEYELASGSYEKIEDKSSLSQEDYQRWCYSYFISGNYQESLAMSDSLIKKKETPAFFFYVNGYSAMAMRNYSVAEQSFTKYSELDSEYFVDSLIASCRQIPNWNDEVFVALEQKDNNNDKSNFSGGKFQNGIIFFHENGKDEKGTVVAEEFLNIAELMFVRPNLYSEEDNQTIAHFSLPEEYADFNLTSFAFDNNSKDVFVTLNNPVSDDEALRIPRIYHGKLSEDYLFEELTLWEYSTMDDAATAHATINESGTVMVFSKQGENTANADLYFSRKTGEKWSEPQELKELNTGGDEMFPLFMGDTLLSFSSNGRIGYGCLDVYLARIASEIDVNEVTHLKAPINSSDDDFNFIYTKGTDAAYFSSNRKGGSGDDDIYLITFRKEIPQETDSSEYENFTDNWKDIIIYFDFDKFKLTSEDKEKIEELRAFVSKFKQVKLDIKGHTDKRGTDEYNMILGKKRAESVRDYLVSIGFNRDDISVTSKGKREPAKDCSAGCTEAEHRLNRFAAITIITDKRSN